MQVRCSTTCVNMHRARLKIPTAKTPSPLASIVPGSPPPHHTTPLYDSTTAWPPCRSTLPCHNLTKVAVLQLGIGQCEKDKEFQGQDPAKTLALNTMLSEEAMDHVKKMCGPGYELDKAGLPVPIEPEAEGSNIAKGPGFFYQPHALAAGMGTEGFLGDEAAVLTEDDLAMVCKLTEDDQKEIKNACYQYMITYFKAMDEEGKGVLVADAFKTAIGNLEEAMPMEAKDAPWMTPKAIALIEAAGAEGTIDYGKFLLEELESPRDDAL